MPTKLRNALAVFLVGLCAAIPLFQHGMPVGVDTYLHLLRMPHLDTLLGSGIVFTRWYPFMIGGYGYPLFNYYPPLGYYPIELLHLIGFSQFAAFKLFWAGGLVVAAGGAYLWGRAIFIRDKAAFIPATTLAIAYTCSPFLLHEVYWRGGLSQYSAHILLPYLFWLIERSIQTRTRRYMVALAVVLAAIVTAHNVTALVIFPYFLVYFALLILLNLSGQHGQVAIMPICVAICLGLGLSAWYWLPALLETDLIQVERVTQTGIMSYADHFQSLRTLLARPTFYDARQLNLSPPRALHLGVLALAVVALFGMWSKSWLHRGRVLAAVGATVFGIWMMLPAAEFVWQSLPLIHFLQFPFRFWGITTLLLALLSAYGVSALPRNNWLIALIWLLLLGYSAPWSFDEYEPIAEPTLADSVAFELETGLLGLSSATEYLPLDVGALPSLDEWRLTEDGEVVESEALRHVVRSSAEKLTFNIFYFPGWQATVDGNPTSIYPHSPHGLIALDLPAGEHTVELSWGTTPPRRTGAIISVISLVGLATLGTWQKPRDAGAVSGNPIPETHSHGHLFLLAPLLLFAVARMVILEPVWAEMTQFDGENVAAIDTPININFGNQVQLFGMMTPSAFAADTTIELDLYWRPLTPQDEDLSIIVTLRDSLGFIVGESSKLHVGDFPTRRWKAGKFALDTHTFSLKEGTPPGDYRVQVTVYKYDNPTAQISTVDGAGNPQGQTVEIGAVTVVAPRRAPRVVESNDARSIVAGLDLLSADLPQSVIQVGEPLPLNLYWQARDSDLPNLTFPLTLTNVEAQTIAQIAPVPAYPTEQWRKGERWRGRHAILLPPDLAAGRYLIQVDSIVLGTVEVTVPERTFEQPVVTREQDELFGEFAQLVGYTVREENGQLVVELVWRAAAQVARGYKTFVQLLDTEGAYLAGSDQVPAQWSRPTTSWLTDEYIIDTHTLPLLENGTQLAIGLYDVETIERLQRANGENVLIVNR